MSYFKILLPLSLVFTCYAHNSGFGSGQPRIAIVGAGISGTSAAYFLSKMPTLDPIIDVYSKDPVGGRLATVMINNRDYETGGSILHPKNKYMKQFLKQFGLKPKKGISGKLGLYDGSEFVFQEGEWSAFNYMSLFWRYGLSLVRMDSMISDMLKKFERIYHTQDEGYAFSNVNDLLGAMDPTFALMLERSLEDGLKEAGISDRFIEELATAVMRVNYGQLPNAHQFVGSVSLAGAESGLWSVSGGNKQIPQALLNASGANLLNEEVDSIHLSPDGRLSLWFKNNDEESPLYDAVILATPLSRDTTTIKFENFPRRFNFPGRYHRTVATMVQGEINYKTFGFHDKKSVVDDIFTTNGSLFFNSVARNYPVDADDGIEGVPPVWKVFSNERLTRSQLELLFSEINETQVIEWKAYPEYDGSESPGNFTLHPGLYHINAIEFAASAIEMGIIGARNVALLTASHFGIDIQEERTQNFHVEL